jgi:hypothetical protein
VTRCQLALDKMTPFSAALLQRRLVDSKQLHSKSFVHSVPLLACRFWAPAVRNTVSHATPTLFQVALSLCVFSTWRDTFTSHSTTFSKRPDCRPSLRFSSSIERRTCFPRCTAQHVRMHAASLCSDADASSTSLHASRRSELSLHCSNCAPTTDVHHTLPS